MPKEQNSYLFNNELVDSDGNATDAMRRWMILTSDNSVAVGSGSPEGVLDAPQYTLYIDETDPENPVQYRKMLVSKNNDRSAGWVQL